MTDDDQLPGKPYGECIACDAPLPELCNTYPECDACFQKHAALADEALRELETAKISTMVEQMKEYDRQSAAVPRDHPLRDREQYRLHCLQEGIGSQLADRFAELRGWKRSRSQFNFRTLGRRQLRDGHRHPRYTYDESSAPLCYTGDLHDLVDHPYYFRDGRRAAAIAVHLYHWDESRKERAEALATRLSLEVREITDFPSWYYPGGTTLVLWTPATSETPDRL